jgi:eukaryotic-like serine/threonine-protein kinase
MDGPRWERIQSVFHDAVDLPVQEREAFVRGACGADETLIAAVVELLEADARAASLLDRDVAAVARHLLTEPAGDGSLPFRQVARYTIVHRLGEGGMGVVYLAEREDLGTRVAMKILRDAWVSPARRERFAIEQRTLGQLNHPSIAKIYDADTLPDGTPWFAMEFVEGLSLTEHCRAEGYAIAERLRLFRDVCDAVQHAHQRLIVHRDLKPSNVLVTRQGAVKLLDFGIAKQLETLDATGDETRTLVRLMTPAYASPEQIRGERAGIQADVYALGVMLYELLAGRRPFDLADLTPAEAEALVMETAPEKPSTVSRTSTHSASGGTASSSQWADLDVLCLTAMHKDPERRYRTVDALIRDIDRYRKGEPLEARGDSLRYRANKFVRRNWKSLSAAAAVFVTVVGLVAFYTVRLSAARDAALAEAARTQRIQRFMLSLFEGGDTQVAPAADLRVVALVDRGVHEARSLDGDAVVQAELYQTLGTIYQKLGNHDRADELLQSALDQRRRVAGADHPDTADNVIALGMLRVDQAKLEEAERLVREGLANLRRTVPPEHPSIARALAALGRVLRERGTYDQAIPPLEEAVRLYSAAPGADADLASTLTALANTHFYAGRFEVSDALNRRVLEMDRRLYGDRHPNVAEDLINLGATQTSLGHHAEAGRYYRDALAIIEPWYGRTHPETASAMTILAQALVPQGSYDEADGLLRQALATQESVYGAVHPRVAFVLNEIGQVAMRRKALDDAERSYGRALNIYSTVYEGKHSRVGVAMANLASVYFAREEYDRAAQLFRKALGVYAELLPADHLNVGIARSKLGRTLLRQQRIQEAEEHLTAAYDIFTKHKSQAWLQNVREDLAAVYAALKQPDKAERFRLELAQNTPKK